MATSDVPHQSYFAPQQQPLSIAEELEVAALIEHSRPAEDHRHRAAAVAQARVIEMEWSFKVENSRRAFDEVVAGHGRRYFIAPRFGTVVIKP